MLCLPWKKLNKVDINGMIELRILSSAVSSSSVLRRISAETKRFTVFVWNVSSSSGGYSTLLSASMGISSSYL